jgi:hypothetical protein
MLVTLFLNAEIMPVAIALHVGVPLSIVIGLGSARLVVSTKRSSERERLSCQFWTGLRR